LALPEVDRPLLAAYADGKVLAKEGAGQQIALAAPRQSAPAGAELAKRAGVVHSELPKILESLPKLQQASVGMTFKSDEQVQAFMMLMQVLSEASASKRELKGKLDLFEHKAQMSESASIRRSGDSAMGHAIGSSIASVGFTVAGAVKSSKGLSMQRQSISNNQAKANSHGQSAAKQAGVLDAAKQSNAALQAQLPKGAQSAKLQENLSSLDATLRGPSVKTAAQASSSDQLLSNKGDSAQLKGKAVMDTGSAASGVINGSGQLVGSLESSGQKVDNAAANALGKASSNERDGYAATDAMINQFFTLLAELNQTKNGLMASIVGLRV
jgi:hypothetical protein